jgi:hypothetical protein
MEITFISKPQAFIWLMVTISTVAFYFLFVRPKIKDRPEFIAFRGNVVGWLKARWDIVAAGFLATLPSAWNGLLDIIVFASNALADVLPALAGADLSGIILPEWLMTTIRIGAVLMPIIRGLMTKEKKDA